jgi:phosphomannomutase
MKLVIFDLDGTLSESKISIDAEMADLICQLIKQKPVAVISGASFSQFEKQFLSHLLCPPENLFVLPATGSAFFEYKNKKGAKATNVGKWQAVYEKSLSDAQKILIRTAFESIFKKFSDFFPRKIYGEQLEDIGLGMTFSALGQEAPLSEKISWDPDHTKRAVIVDELRPLLPGVAMTIGGTTSINITASGADKEHAIASLAEYFSIPQNRLKEDILYIGDSLFPEGNDYGAIKAGVATQKVAGPADTKKIIRGILENV